VSSEWPTGPADSLFHRSRNSTDMFFCLAGGDPVDRVFPIGSMWSKRAALVGGTPPMLGTIIQKMVQYRVSSVSRLTIRRAE
jgi:hypothetical protein